MKTATTDKWRYRRTPFAKQRDEDSGFYALAAAIVKQAVDDYREADRLLEGKIKYSGMGITAPERTKKEVIKFFKSQWYGTLCDIDPNRILAKLGVKA